jgi:hypothetical protein
MKNATTVFAVAYSEIGSIDAFDICIPRSILCTANTCISRSSKQFDIARSITIRGISKVTSQAMSLTFTCVQDHPQPSPICKTNSHPNTPARPSHIRNTTTSHSPHFTNSRNPSTRNETVEINSAPRVSISYTCTLQKRLSLPKLQIRRSNLAQKTLVKSKPIRADEVVETEPAR